MDKLCVICKRFYFEGWTRGYSEYTPSGRTHFGCGAHKPEWNDFPTENCSVEDYRRVIRTAETCSSFEPAQD